MLRGEGDGARVPDSLQTHSYSPLRVFLSLWPLKSDQHVISPYIITPGSNIQVTRKEKMIINWRSSWLLNKFSSLAPKEMYREQYGEYAFWCWGYKGSKHEPVIF